MKLLKVARLALGVFMIFNTAVGSLIPLEKLPLSHAGLAVLQSFWATGYLSYLVKGTEFGVGVLFTMGYTPLALVVFAPLLVNILCFHIFYERGALILSLPMSVTAFFLARQNWKSFKPLFVRSTR